MLNEIWKLSHVQVGQNYERSKSSNVTHYRDGTTKIGRHYEDSQISTQSGCFSLEIGEKLGGSTKTKNFKETFNQIAMNFESSSNDITKNNVADKLIANIKKRNVRYSIGLNVCNILCLSMMFCLKIKNVTRSTTHNFSVVCILS